MKISLIGMPGSGKSTIGKSLSEMLNIAFFDSDDIIEKKEKQKD
jgi:shikimate kinase